MPVIYEVNLSVNPSIQSDFGQWLEIHIKEMLALPGFQSAQWWQVETESELIEWCVHYILDDRNSLQRYFEEFASQMRGDGLTRFGDHFQASRRILLPRLSAGTAQLT